MITGKQSWSKEVLCKKYFPGSRKRCLDSATPTRNGSPIYKLCIKALPLFKRYLYWIPGNGKSIRVWEDSILGEAPLGQHRELDNIKLWLIDKGATSLWDISIWNNNSWIGWDLGDPPPELKTEADTLSQFLQGKSPLKADSRDKRGWGPSSGIYTASEGYKLIKAIPYAVPNPAIWNFLWTKAFIPKIDMFCWTLAHKSILSGENLKKRGLEGPSRCPLCKNDEETMDHIMIDCQFSQEAWRDALVISGINLPGSIQSLLSNWMKLSPFSLSKKPLLQAARRWLPKAICWKIWLERNNRIFREIDHPPSKIAMNAKAIVGEALEHSSSLHVAAPLTAEESQWLDQLVPNLQIRSRTSPPNLAEWEIRMDESGFIKWKASLTELCLFFDGASKGNPGAAGGGGVFVSAEGIMVSSFAWGLGIESNNTAEFCALWQGLRIARSKGITMLTVFGDSRMLIQALIKKKRPSQIKLALLYQKIHLILQSFRSISFYHVLRGLNTLADREANRGVLQGRGMLHLDGSETRCDIP